MASDQIRYNKDVANPDVQQGLDKVLLTYKAINAEITKLKSSKITVPKGTSGADAKSINQVTKQRIDDTKKITALKKEQIKVEKEVARIRKQELSTSEALGKQRSKAFTQANKLLQKEKELISNAKIQVRSIEDLRIKTNALVKTRDRLDNKTKKGAKEFKRLTRAIAINEKQLKRYDKQIGRSQRNVGNYGKSISGLAGKFAGALGLVGGIMLARRALVGMFNTFKDFDKAQSKLASILGTTKEGVSGLTETAIQLGSTMVFTASQVTELQTELAKLGFSEGEIINAQRGVLNLAAATGFDLAEAAAISGAALRSFGLDAREMARVTDVMALATSKSALDMQKLATALPTVASTAKVAGVTIERTTALLGVLADRGLDASTSATSLRNVFLELSKQGLTWEQAMRKINSATDKNVAALELFGKRGATTGVILAQNAKQADELTISLNGAAGAAERMAEVQLDNLAGDITRLSSAWEGLVLQIEKGDGALAKFLRNSTKLFTLGLGEAAKIGQTFRDIALAEQFDSATKSVERFVDGLRDINEEMTSDEQEKARKANKEDIKFRISQLNEEIELNKQLLKEKDILSQKVGIADVGAGAILQSEERKRDIRISKINVLLELEAKNLQEILDIEKDRAEQSVKDIENAKILAEELEAARIAALGTIKGLGDEISRLNKIRNLSHDKERIADIAIEIQLLKNLKKALENLGKTPEVKARKRRTFKDSGITFGETKDGKPTGEATTKKGIEALGIADEEDLVIAERQVEETTLAMLEAIEKKGEGINTGDTFLAKLLGITDEDAEKLKSSLQEIAAITAEFLDSQFKAQENAARKEADFRQTEIERLRDERRDALIAQQQGNANELDDIDKKIKEEERLRDEAIANEAEAVRKRQQLATIMQIANLVLAASEIFANESKEGAPGVIVAIAAIALMLSAFAGFKARSVDVGGRDGMYVSNGEIVTTTGKRHNSDGSGGENVLDHVKVEKGEDLAVFSRNASRKHHDLIKRFTHAANTDNFSNLQFAKTPNIEQNDFNIMLSTAELQQQNITMIANQEIMIKLMSVKQQIEKGLWVDPFGNIESNRLE